MCAYVYSLPSHEQSLFANRKDSNVISSNPLMSNYFFLFLPFLDFFWDFFWISIMSNYFFLFLPFLDFFWDCAASPFSAASFFSIFSFSFFSSTARVSTGSFFSETR